MSIEVYNTLGNLVYSSEFVGGGSVTQIYNISSNQTYTYPDFAGRTLLLNIIHNDYGTFAIDYALGYPRLIVTTFTPTYFFVTMR